MQQMMPYIDSHSLNTVHSHTKHLFSASFSSPFFLQSPLMVPEMETPRATEIKVRMDCNGCVQKIKKALQGITGIHDIYVDFSEQKVTITGWAEPEKLVKAIRKTRKSAVICVHTEQSDPPPEGETTPEEGAPPPPETPPEPTTRAEPAPAEAPDEPPQLENPEPATSQPHQPPKPNNIEGIHVVYHHPPDHGYQYPYGPNHQQGHSGPWNAYHVGPGFRNEPYHPPQPVYVQSYNTYRPSPQVTEYAYPQPPPRYSYNTRPDHSSGPEFRDEPPQPMQPPQQPRQPVYATHSYNTYKPSPCVTGFAYPPSPPKHSPYSRADNSSLGLRDEGEPSQPPRPVYATHSHNIYKPSPYVSEYAYPEPPSRYSSYSVPDNYSRDYYSGNHENGNVTSMFSEENPNACRIV